uniref:Uncharacterized protein n=1 Tax=Dikerogammarus haemobaphes virus 1 TaxID=2704946 RepID=A0A6G9HE31_9VIRU|nr:hypothetical protein [Dikerogammarus haemobaphes virus 1]
MLYFTKDHVNAFILKSINNKNVMDNFILPKKFESYLSNLKDDDLILHISNPVSDHIYNIDKYSDNPRLIIYDPKGIKTKGYWKQVILALIKTNTREPCIVPLETMLNEPEYMVKYIYYFLGKSPPINNTNIDFYDLILCVTHLFTRD